MAGLAALLGSAPISTNTAPQTGYITTYNAASGPLTVTLPALSMVAVGANLMVAKGTPDLSGNTITFNCAGADTFDDGTTSLGMITPGEARTLQVVKIGSVKYWKIMSTSVNSNTVLPEIFMMSLAVDQTLTNSGVAEKCFNATTNGAITLPASSGYMFDAEYLLTNTGTTSHTWSVLFAGTATITALDFSVRGSPGTTSPATLSSIFSAFQQNGPGSLPTAALAGTAASTSATENVILALRGILRINGAGTFIPQIKPSAATTGTAKMLRGSSFRLTPIGSDTATSLGPWS